MKPIHLGKKYRHYKGNEYLVLNIAKHSETHEPLVIYQDCKEPEKIWARPQSMFLVEVEFENRLVQRFEKIEND